MPRKPPRRSAPPPTCSRCGKPEDRCVQCGQPFQRETRTQLYCGAPCRMAAWGLRTIAAKAAPATDAR